MKICLIQKTCLYKQQVMETLITILTIMTPLDFSGIIAGIVLLSGLIGLYIKQNKDISEIKLTMKRDKQETDKEIALLKIQLESQGSKDDQMFNMLFDIKTNQAVFDEKITNLIKKYE
jgi:hypothetical protein